MNHQTILSAQKSGKTNATEQGIKKAIGLKLNLVRIERGLTIRQLAEKSGVDNTNTLWRILKGGRGCRFVTLFNITDALDFPKSRLFEIFDNRKQLLTLHQEKEKESYLVKDEIKRLFFKCLDSDKITGKEKEVLAILKSLSIILGE